MKWDALGLPLTLDVEGADILIVGDGEEADRKQAMCEDSGAHVTRAPQFDAALLGGKRLVLVCVRDAQIAAQVHAAARLQGVLTWCSDDPEHSDFAMPAVARLGLMQAAFSTSGHSPALASQLRRAFAAGLGEKLARFVEALGQERERLRREERDPDRRRAALQALIDGFTVEIAARYPDWFES
jgi:uroporphyrin-III C-methyltransferase / precorrin-2 dehydrogenase / sirohydrochlorin ferrochelatase